MPRWRLTVSECSEFCSSVCVCVCVCVCVRTTATAAAASELSAERVAELDGHGVVEDRVDGAVGVDGQTTEQHQPAVLVAPTGERVVDDVRPIGQPQRCKHRDDHCQHLHHLHTSSTRCRSRVDVSTMPTPTRNPDMCLET